MRSNGSVKLISHASGNVRNANANRVSSPMASDEDLAARRARLPRRTKPSRAATACRHQFIDAADTIRLSRGDSRPPVLSGSVSCSCNSLTPADADIMLLNLEGTRR